MAKQELLITLTADDKDANNVTIAFTMALKALEKGHDAKIMLLSNAVHIGQKGFADKIDIGAPFKPIKELLPAYMEQGGKLDVCSSCMKHNGIEESEIIEGADIIQADDVVDSLMTADRTLQLN